MPAVDTKQRILDIAEQHFAEQGYAGASLRGIIAAAGVNLAAVHYHFHSKEALLEAVLMRRAAPLNEERAKLLAECEARAGKSAPPVEEILEAFIGPPMRLILNPSGEGRIFGMLVGRLHAETGAMFCQISKKHFAPVSQRFRNTLHRVFPKLPEEDIYWRLHCAAGAMAHTLTQWDQLETVSDGILKTNDVESVIERMVRFLAAGFCAPAGGVRPKATKPGSKMTSAALRFKGTR
jgi:AcrR family transcriptional regulator